MPRVAQLVDGRVGPQMHAVWALEPILNHYIILLLIPSSQGVHLHKLSLSSPDTPEQSCISSLKESRRPSSQGSLTFSPVLFVDFHIILVLLIFPFCENSIRLVFDWVLDVHMICYSCVNKWNALVKFYLTKIWYNN